MKLVGEKVLLRPIEVEDAKRFVELINDEEVRQYLALVFPINKYMEENWLKNDANNFNTVTLGIEVKDKNLLVGSTGLNNIDWINRQAEFGIGIFDKNYWNKGLGTEATKLVLKYAFEYLNLNRVYLKTYEYNKRAIRVYEKCGFLLEGKERQAKYLKGKYWDLVRMSILAEDYWRSFENQ
ncbi:MAG: GNAT family N-acetyltransferase [Thermosipho sp. (in: Bacteria)]|nr:GNAT family N-acetyltransferase [Thermosipho sp. (in: thermotogales)]